MLKVIDVSYANGTVDWESVKRQKQVDAVILRIGYRGYASEGVIKKDSTFDENMKKVTLPYGYYFFSQAKNYNEGVEEAKKTLEFMKPYTPPSLPIYFDTEWSTNYPYGRADKIQVKDRIEATKGFCETIHNAGYRVGVYCAESWFATHLNGAAWLYDTPYSIWIANINKKPVIKYGAWQYAHAGSVSGIKGQVDLNYFDEDLLLPVPEDKMDYTVSKDETARYGVPLSVIKETHMYKTERYHTSSKIRGLKMFDKLMWFGYNTKDCYYVADENGKTGWVRKDAVCKR